MRVRLTGDKQPFFNLSCKVCDEVQHQENLLKSRHVEAAQEQRRNQLRAPQHRWHSTQVGWFVASSTATCDLQWEVCKIGENTPTKQIPMFPLASYRVSKHQLSHRCGSPLL